MIIDEKKGFSTTDKKIRIFDVNGKPFYFFDRTKGEKTCFNMPKGEFTTDNNLTELKNPVTYKIKKLPTIERRRKLPEHFKFIGTKNPNKCSVFLNKGIIIFDKEFIKKQIKPSLVFIGLHELGHFFYENESKCDHFATYQMLKLGYNPSQCTIATNTTLNGKHSKDRKNYIYSISKKAKSKIY